MYDQGPPTDEVLIQRGPSRAESQRRVARQVRLGAVVMVAAVIALGALVWNSNRIAQDALRVAQHDHALLIRAAIREHAVVKELRHVCHAVPRCHLSRR